MKHNKSIKQSDIKVRKSWGDLNPVTRVVESKKAYSRKDKHKSRYYHEGFVD